MVARVSQNAQRPCHLPVLCTVTTVMTCRSAGQAGTRSGPYAHTTANLGSRAGAPSTSSLPITIGTHLQCRAVRLSADHPFSRRYDHHADPSGSEAYRRVRARKLRQRRWRCVTGPADRRRRDRRPCPCQLRAGGLCAVRGKAPLLICSGAASRRGLPYGGSTRSHGGSTRRQGHLRRFTGLRLRCADWRAEAEAVTVFP